METNTEIAEDLGAIPQTRSGNPKPGKFEDNQEHDCVAEYTYSEPVTSLCAVVAAHAVVEMELDRAVSETAWGDGTGFPGRNWAEYILQECTVEFPEGGIASVAFEDLPVGTNQNDYDYNDLVFNISGALTVASESTNVSAIDLTVTQVANLAGFNHTAHLVINNTTLPGCTGTWELFYGVTPQGSGSLPVDVITIGNSKTAQAAATLKVALNPGCPIPADLTAPSGKYHGEWLFFDPYIKVNNTGEFIHAGDVRMVVVPTNWAFPPETIRIWTRHSGVTAGDPPKFSDDWWLTGAP